MRPGHATKPHALTSLASGGTLQYDPDGNVARKTSAGHFYRYDSQSRLLCVGTDAAGCQVAEASYDVDGRRITHREGSGATRVRLADL